MGSTLTFTPPGPRPNHPRRGGVPHEQCFTLPLTQGAPLQRDLHLEHHLVGVDTIIALHDAHAEGEIWQAAAAL